MKRLLGVLLLMALAAATIMGATAPAPNPTLHSIHMDTVGDNLRVTIRAKANSGGTGDTLQIYFYPIDSCMALFPGGPGSTNKNFLYYVQCNTGDTIKLEDQSQDTAKWFINDDTTVVITIEGDTVTSSANSNYVRWAPAPGVTVVMIADTIGQPDILGSITLIGQVRFMIDSATSGDVRQFLPFDTTHAGGPDNNDVWAWNTSNGQWEIAAQSGGGGGGSDSALHLVNVAAAAIALTVIEDTLVYIDVTDNDTLKTWSETNGDIWTRPGQDGNQRWIVIVDTVVDAAGNRIGSFGNGAVSSGLEVVNGLLRIDADMAGAGLNGGGGFTFNVGVAGGLAVTAVHVIAATDGVTIDTNGTFKTLQVINDGITGLKLAPAVAGLGLVQDGSGNLDIGAGTGITVNANDIEATLGTSITTGELANHAVDTSKMNISNNPQVTDALLVNGAAGTMTFQPMVTAAGAGLTAAAGPIFAVGAGTGITVAADAVSATLGTSIATGEIDQHAVDTSKINATNVGGTDAFLTNGTSGTFDWQAHGTVAGAGLASAAGPILSVGQGTGITVNANDIETTLGTSVDLAAEVDGLLPHENGGLELNVSAFTGLLAISAGATSEIDSKSELEAQIADVANFAEADGDTYTGQHNFGGATDLEIPNEPTPTTNATGEIAFGTTNNMLEVFDGTSSLVLAGLNKPFSFPISDPDLLAKDTVMLIGIESEWAPNGVTITSIGIKTWASSTYSVRFMWYTQPGNGGTETVIKIVATSGSTEAKETSGFTDAAGAVGDILVIELPTTNIDHVTVFGTFTIND